MAKLTRLNVKTTGIRKLLSLPLVEADVGARGLRIADAVEAAGIRVEGRPGRIDLPVTVTTTNTGKRARARVILDHPAGQAVEAKHGILAASLDAGGDL
jgi:hypothetical protein